MSGTAKHSEEIQTLGEPRIVSPGNHQKHILQTKKEFEGLAYPELLVD